MEFKQIPVKNQKFDISRTINIAECNCAKCDFMNCPKHNYCVEMERYRYSIDEFLEQFGDKLISANSVKDFLITDYQANELADCFPKFPKNTFWDVQGDSIRIVKQGPAGRFFPLHAKITLYDNRAVIYTTDICKQAQEKLAYKILDLVNALYKYRRDHDIERTV